MIDGFVQAYSSHDFLIECPTKISCYTSFNSKKSQKKKIKLSCQNKIPTTFKIVFVSKISKYYMKSMTP